ncbi:adenine phosphoribosyltransferase [Thermoanaerobacterium sp. RBIITD]|uniref:adenine phosphoribosyltransferase n=1 Tax=Thermoanaerobacterium sp. RBIITD TaxID=1550240 RepID=UPI000BB72255|nr:adenine phosphoribosyltransferase [Thermoanaerobacterium sp. RBIITD]SNX52646.1 adenine phosphoribosyltransferase [Thermoanaerobacterium sp. RBIITD]
MKLDDVKSLIREIPDFPRKGIGFKDITPVLKDKDAFSYSVNMLADALKGRNVDLIAGPEARGFLFGAPLAYKMGIGFIPVRKPGKLPAETIKYEYELEYGMDSLEIHKDAIKKGKRVVIVDDLLATGGTIFAAAKLIEELGGIVDCILFLTELTFLDGRKKLDGYDIISLIKF